MKQVKLDQLKDDAPHLRQPETMMSVAEMRKRYPQELQHYSDEQVEQVRTEIYALAHIIGRLIMEEQKRSKNVR
jgi:hypothetical protein